MFLRIATGLFGAAAIVALSGCTQSGTSAVNEPTGPASPVAASTTGAPAATSATDGPSPTPLPPSASAAGTAGGCPASASTLLSALRSSDVYQQLAPTSKLTDITCYGGYALATTAPSEADPATVVFRFTGGAWKAVGGGTSGYCDGVVPDDVRPHLGHCN